MKVTAFALDLPADGSQRADVDLMIGAGMHLSREEEETLKAGCNCVDRIRITYTCEFTGVADKLPAVTHRLESCARLVRAGKGGIPESQVARLRRLRDLFRGASQACAGLLDAAGEA